jgi:hypothetical protein
MKLTAAILLFLIIFSSLFYSGYFNALVFQAKEEAREAIAEKNGTDSFKIIKIPLKINKQSNEDEIWLDHQLYDAIKKEIIRDTVYEYLYHDKNEESVLSEIGSFFKDDDDNYFPPSSDVPVFKGIHNIANQPYAFCASVTVLKDRSTLPEIFPEKKYHIQNKTCEVLTPPPRLFSFLS